MDREKSKCSEKKSHAATFPQQSKMRKNISAQTEVFPCNCIQKRRRLLCLRAKNSSFTLNKFTWIALLRTTYYNIISNSLMAFKEDK